MHDIYCTSMNHCNPDSSTKTHISSRAKTCLFQKLLSTENSHILSPRTCLLTQRFTYPLTKTCHCSKALPENPHIFPHKPLLSKTLPQNIHTSSHTKHVFSITLLYRNFIHPLTQNMSFYMPSFTKVHISSHQNMPFSKALPQKIHISSYTNHALFHSKTLPQKIHTSSHPTHVFSHVFFQ